MVRHAPNHSLPFGLSLPKPRAALRQAQRERIVVVERERVQATLYRTDRAPHLGIQPAQRGRNILNRCSGPTVK